METQTPGSAPTAGFLKQMEDFFNTYLHQKVPFHFPSEFRQWIVKFGPWITLVVMILTLPATLTALGLQTAFSPFAAFYGYWHYGPVYMLSGLINLAALIMQAIALPALFKRGLSGWHLVYYSVLVHGVGQLFMGDVIGLIVSVVVSMYVLFEIREYYK